jgi:hypothetical protein
MNYSCTISTSPTDAAGNVTTTITSDRINDGNFTSSEDFADTGPTVIDGQTGVKRAVFSDADLQATDMIEVAGVPMTVAQARAAGVNISVDARASQAVAPQAPGADDVADQVDDAVDQRMTGDGRATDAEAVALDNVVQAVAMHTGLDQEATLELGNDILKGEIAQDDPIWTGLLNKGISKDAVHGSIQQVVQVGQNAAMRELGHAAYAELDNLAANSAAVRNLVLDHGIKRMSGKSKGVTWKQVLNLARQFARS